MDKESGKGCTVAFSICISVYICCKEEVIKDHRKRDFVDLGSGDGKWYVEWRSY